VRGYILKSFHRKDRIPTVSLGVGQIKMAIELFVLTWGVYPRRVLIYLAEKGLLNSPEITITPITLQNGNQMVAPGKPPGTVPILKLGENRFIKQSIAILEYLEDSCDAAQASEKQPFGVQAAGTMRGKTAEEKARTRSVIGLVDEAMIHFGVACHKGTALFASLEEQSLVTADMALEASQRTLGLVECYYEDHSIHDVTIADCVLFSLLQFSREFYGKDLIRDCPNLKRFYETFKERESVKIGEGLYPEPLVPLARTWNEN
jgi:glutathione S-transferase